MTDSRDDKTLEAVRAAHHEHPGQLSTRALINLIEGRLDSRPTRAQVRTAISTVVSDPAGWIIDWDIPTAGPTVETLLEEWLTAGPERESLATQITEAIARGSTSDSVRTLAALLGAVDGDVDLGSLVLDDTTPILREAAFAAALRSSSIEWAIDHLACSAKPLPRDVKEFLVGTPPPEFGQLVADRLVTWPARAVNEAEVAKALPKLLELATLTRSHDTLTALLRGMAAVGAQTPTPKWLEAILEFTVAEPELLRESLNSMDAQHVELVLQATSRVPFRDVAQHLPAKSRPSGKKGPQRGSGCPRRDLLTAVAYSSRRSQLSAPDVWAGAKPELISDMLSLSTLESVLLDIVDRPVLASIVEREAKAASVARLLALAVRSPNLSKYITVQHLQVAAARDDAAAQLVRAFADSATAALSTTVDELRTALKAAGATQQQLEEAARNRDATIADLERSQRELRTLLAQRSESTRTALIAEINQGRFDALRVLCNTTEVVRALADLDGPAQQAATGLLRDLVRQLDELGVTVEGEPGQVRGARGDLDVPFTPGCTVQVVSPAYLAVGTVTPIRRAFVRFIEEEHQT